jgi:hypothetical protein
MTDAIKLAIESLEGMNELLPILTYFVGLGAGIFLGWRTWRLPQLQYKKETK